MNYAKIALNLLDAAFEYRHQSKEQLKEQTSTEPLFNSIIGYGDVKDIFQRAIASEEPVHILLSGHPGSAKTLFMLELMKLERSYFTLGSHSSKAGLVDYLFAKRPRYLILDELEHMNAIDMTVLLSLMETGIISETKHGKTRDTQLKTWVFGSCNSTEKLSRALLSRFLTLTFKRYTYEEFKTISNNLLVMRGINSELADYISHVVWHGLDSNDIRDSLKIAKLAKSSDDVDWLVQTLSNY